MYHYLKDYLGHKKILLILLAVLLISVFIIHHFFHGKPNAGTNTLITAKKGTITERVVAVGNIMPEQSIEVKSPIAGTVAKLFHDAGDYVKANEPLLEVKPQPTPDDYAAARQQVKTDEVDLANAKKNLQRYEYLFRQHAISVDDQDYSSAKTTYNKSQLTLELDKEKLALLEQGAANIGGRTIANVISSPIEGYILDRDVDLGAPVIAQSNAQQGNTLFTIANMDHLIFKGQVSEIDAAKIHKDMPATLEVAAYPNIKISGVLSQIALQSVQANSSDNNSQNSANTGSPFNVGFQVQVSHLKIPDNARLLAGYSATATIVIKTVKDVLVIPERILQFADDKPYVWLRDSKGAAQKRFIQVGLSDGMDVQILSGLKAGDQVFSEAPKRSE